ncbi:hypothetical protein ZIOFF_002308 [Zingiber officinale]|uniref:MHD2 domain-containing protein n=1 Tax=Zingiber officinale TaxID=94328 RepID=A0A8J5HZP3_ZINOF|nr:hypothetical protein ZIOFF_002308 [Zingiber officinale]
MVPAVNKEDLIPPEPILTRYKKESGIKAFVKKEVAEIRVVEDKKSSQISSLTTVKLCVRLNTLHKVDSDVGWFKLKDFGRRQIGENRLEKVNETLGILSCIQYAITQLNKLEDSIYDRWTRKKQENFSISMSKFYVGHPMSDKSRSFNSNQKNAFDRSRKEINAAIDKICEFSGTKVIFWDLREPYIINLYKNSVSQARLEALIDAFDSVLNQLCDVIVEPLRDRVVTGLLQASLDGLLRIILDGGPSRVFFLSDAKLIEDDLEILKEFFISGGDGLPRGTVENLVARIRPVISLLGYEPMGRKVMPDTTPEPCRAGHSTSPTRVLIDDLRDVTQGGRSKFGADTKTLLRILCHRSDSEASQFLKKQFKIPKSSS